MASIRKLIDSTRTVHVLNFEYQGEGYELPWMELQSGEEPAVTEQDFDKLDESARAKAMVNTIDEVAFACIAKGLRARDGEDLTIEEWKQLPQRLRILIAQQMFVEKRAEEEHFLPGRQKTPS